MRTLFALAGAACLCLAAAPPAKADQTFSIVQDKPALTHIDVGPSGPSHGDILAFEAPFTSQDGAKGIMSGMLTTVDMPDTEGDPFQDRIATIVLDFGGIDSLVIGGKSLYAKGQAEMTADAPQVRAVIGGTGRFLGARGQVTTTRKDAGHYEHVVQLVD
ncbi:hypothetical protein FHS85_002944 [Rhodoligotrophos appendicifer]|uniref:hypothetical protein n=1 Tax=Rhodoligotrophos appendicifer TaxID=987056 RepID=UPI001185FD53|nr:hypothetical protein [Rhodoligotrophos appendicifer]